MPGPGNSRIVRVERAGPQDAWDRVRVHKAADPNPVDSSSRSAALMSTKREPHAGEPSPALLAARRCRVWRRHDLCLRYGEAYVQAQVDARRWQAALPHVVVQHNGPLSGDQRLGAVLTSGPPGTLLHGLSGLTFDGLRGLSPDRLTVVIAGSSAGRGSRQLATPPGWDVALRWSTKLGPEDVNPLVLPPRTRVARSVVDAASERVPVRRARVIVLASAQQQLVLPRQLRTR